MNKININGKDFTIEELNKIIEESKTENSEAEKEKLFLELFQGLEIRSDIEKYPNTVFYYRNGRFVLEIERDRLWVDYTTIWSNFRYKFGMGDNEIQSFIQDMIEKHFKWMGLKPFHRNPSGFSKVENHFK